MTTTELSDVDIASQYEKESVDEPHIVTLSGAVKAAYNKAKRAGDAQDEISKHRAWLVNMERKKMGSDPVCSQQKTLFDF